MGIGTSRLNPLHVLSHESLYVQNFVTMEPRGKFSRAKRLCLRSKTENEGFL